ncbi:cullin family-like protein [Thalassiosira pseudonana CCMP1335]|uniref:Cullin family-like protein n=1 Tax=Thalassiosira pseudonana TaxID=35128 RepID=B8CER2_THAPS|nr:cullin family-like protein [Thalassiosira pseudonana CCMP1335]EED88081.1 cullin family-like protein [Thalassiosira pseudonana CCMP1335]
MDTPSASSTFQSLSSAMDEIHNRNASTLSFEELYRNAYNLVLHKHGGLLYEGVTERLTWHLRRSGGRLVSSGREYKLLEELSTVWKEHRITMVMVRDIFMYMDRTYVPQNRRRPVYDLGLYLFRRVSPTLGNVTSLLLLRVVHQDRMDRLDDAPQRIALCKSLIHMLLELAHATSAGANAIPVYERDFEEVFLGESQDFYRMESASRLSQGAAMEYVHHAQARLVEEKARAALLDLPAQTRVNLMNIVETELIERHAKTLVEMEGSGFADNNGVVVDHARIADLAAMYELFSRVPSSVNHLRDALSERIRLDGRSLVRDQETNVAPPAAFVKGVLAMRERFHAVVTEAMKGEKKAQKRMKEAFEDFLNADARAANCLAVYVDELLRVGLRGADERKVSSELDRAIVIFRFLADKDVFEAYYKSHLAKRLLGNKSGNEDAERAMVSLLKAECGYQFTSKLEGMFNDIRISKETAEKYRSHKKKSNNEPVDVEVSVLTTGYWPSQNVPPCILPPPVRAAMDRFQKYYLNTYTGRKLSWQTLAGTAEIRATFPPPKGSSKPRRHDLTVTTYQMCILVLFNNRDTLTLKQIREEIQIPEDELRRHLVSLCTPKHRILKKGSKGKAISGDDDTFTYNSDYTSKMTKVKVPMVSMRDATASAKSDGAAGSLPASVEEDRRHLLEAAIVRIMKARKMLNHNDLVAEVTKQLAGRFIPPPQFVKKRVESLIEREYLERDEADRRVYLYMA